MAWKCIVTDDPITDVKEDRKNAVRVEQYKVSSQAIYFNGQYLPLASIRDVQVHESSFTPGMSCGKGIPVYKLRIDYGADKPLVLMVEKEKNVQKITEMIKG